MNIHEATKKALSSNSAISRVEESWEYIYIVPTNTDGACFIVEFGLSDEEKPPGKKWNPYLSDLLAEDWEVVDQRERCWDELAFISEGEQNIYSAARKAHLQGKGIARAIWGPAGNYILLTNTLDCCLVIPSRGTIELNDKWAPNALDLLATDWIVTG